MSMKIIGNTVGTTTPKPNLMQTDPTKGDYVKGKEGFLEQVTDIIEEHIDSVNIELNHTVKSINGVTPDENGNVEISEGEQADWNQNDETAPDYVKNRTHWEERNIVYLIPETAVTIAANNIYTTISKTCPTLIAGETYIVTLNGVTYNCIARPHTNCVIIGNGKIDGDGINVNNEPFLIDSYSSGAIYLNTPVAGNYTVSIQYCESIVHTIDPKYLPESVKQTYVLPIATSNHLGGVKSGGDITVNEDGTMVLSTGSVDDVIQTAVNKYLEENPIEGGVNFETDSTLTLKDGVLSINTTDQMEQDNTLPITSAGVYATVGNIEALLKTI